MKTAFKAFLVILLIELSAVVISCSTEEDLARKKAETYFLDADFILLDKKENTVYDSENRSPAKIRTWVVYRIDNNYTDSIDVAEIMSKVTERNDCGCTPGSDFVITNELWFNKEIGDILHFDFIRKDRFFRTTKEKLGLTTSTVEMPYSGTTTVTSIPVSTDTEKLEIERKIMQLETEIELLKQKL